MKIVLTAVLTCIWGNALAAEPTPNLPPADVVARVLRATPSFAAARGKVLVKLNVGDADLDKVIELVPSMKAPTVSKLHGDGGYAVETVVAKREINILIPALKDAGASDIIGLECSGRIAATALCPVPTRSAPQRPSTTPAPVWMASPVATTVPRMKFC